jgi:tetratricopeptide (TPR) repeat protein
MRKTIHPFTDRSLAINQHPDVARAKEVFAITRVSIRRVSIVIIFAGALLIALASCNRSPVANEPTEQRWIVESILRDIAGMALYAGDRKGAPLPADGLMIESLPADAKGYHYKITLHLPGKGLSVRQQVDIGGAIWAPESYTPVARELLEKLQVAEKADATPLRENPLQPLVSPLAANIQRENLRVSTLLTEHPLSPEAHEQAALIIGVLGMRENSGDLWDTRGMCNRAVAHLAMAQAIRGGQAMSVSGEIGELLVEILDDTKQECEQRIAALKNRVQANPEIASWIVAAQLRNRRDWRVLVDPAKASLLERIEYFRARCESISPDAAASELLKGHPENIADWSNNILQFNFSVGVGHTFTESGLKAEFYEIVQIFPAIRAAKLTPETLAATLNKAPGGAVQRDASGNARMIPIDDGMWAHFFQRHLCHLASRTDLFLRQKWGVPDYADKFEKSIGPLFSKLTFGPILCVLWQSPHPADQQYVQSTIELVKQHPEWISSATWTRIPRTASAQVPDIAGWFSPGLPAGTAYCYYGRDECIPQVRDLSRDELQKLYKIAPWHYGVALSYMKALYGKNPTPAQFRSVLGPFLDFKIGAMYWYAQCAKDDMKEYVSIHQQIAKLEPYDYITLSAYYREHKMDNEAAEAIQAAIDHQADPVAVTYYSGWLVNYYFDHGQKDRALAIATDAAEVYSSAGLTTMAELQERMENPQQAETYFEKIKERYDETGPLIAFYQRQATVHPGSPYTAKLESSLGSLFPGGVKSVTMADFTEPPKNGVIIAEQDNFLLKCGMKKGTIIVALDGKRVQSFPQYAFVRELTKSPTMEFIVFQNGKYQFVKAEVEGRRFGLEFHTWPE